MHGTSTARRWFGGLLVAVIGILTIRSAEPPLKQPFHQFDEGPKHSKDKRPGNNQNDEPLDQDGKLYTWLHEAGKQSGESR